MNGNGKNDFASQVRIRAEEKAKEYMARAHEIRRLEVLQVRTKDYVEQLNRFLEAEGQRPVLLKESHTISGVGKPGNRSKDMPVRKVEWEGMSMNEIVGRVLNATPDVTYHYTEIAPKIYEIYSDLDLRKVAKNLRSTLQRGVKDGLWERTGRAKFKAKVTAQQGKLVSV
jgi:hypothetical protein